MRQNAPYSDTLCTDMRKGYLVDGEQYLKDKDAVAPMRQYHLA